MGWSTGSLLMSDIISVLEKKLLFYDRKEIYELLIPIFENYDCDTLYECADDDKAFHEALLEVDPDYRESLKDEDDWNEEEEC